MFTQRLFIDFKRNNRSKQKLFWLRGVTKISAVSNDTKESDFKTLNIYKEMFNLLYEYWVKIGLNHEKIGCPTGTATNVISDTL